MKYNPESELNHVNPGFEKLANDFFNHWSGAMWSEDAVKSLSDLLVLVHQRGIGVGRQQLQDEQEAQCLTNSELINDIYSQLETEPVELPPVTFTTEELEAFFRED